MERGFQPGLDLDGLKCIVWDSVDPLAQTTAQVFVGLGADVTVVGENAREFAKNQLGDPNRGIEVALTAPWNGVRLSPPGGLDVAVVVPPWNLAGRQFQADVGVPWQRIASVLRSVVGITNMLGQALADHGSGKLIFIISGLHDRGVPGLAYQGLVDGALSSRPKLV